MSESVTPLKAGLDAIASTDDLEMIRQLKRVIEGKEAELRLRGIGGVEQETAGVETKWREKIGGTTGAAASHGPEVASAQLHALIGVMKEYVNAVSPDQARHATPMFREVYDALCDKAGMDFSNEQDFDHLTFGHYKHHVGKIQKLQIVELEKAVNVNERMERFLGSQVERLLGITPQGRVGVIETARSYKVKNRNEPTGFEERVSHSKKLSFTDENGKQRQVALNTASRKF